MRDNGIKTTENRMLIRRGFFFLYIRRSGCALTLSRSLTLSHKDFFYAPKFPFVSEKKGNKKKMEGHRERKRNNFVIPILSFAVNFIFHFTFPNLPCPSSSIAFPCVCRQNAREEESQQQWLCQHNKGTTCNVHPLPSGPDVKPTRLTNTWRVLLL